MGNPDLGRPRGHHDPVPPTGPRPSPAARSAAALPSNVGAPRAPRAAGRHGAAVPVEPVGVGLRERLLRRRGPGRHPVLEGLAVRLARLRQRDHRRQAPGVALGDDAQRADLRLQLLEPAGAAGADGRRVRRPAARGRPPLGRARRGPARRRRAGPDPRGRADVPVRQPGRAAGAAARRRRLRDGARDRRGLDQGVHVVARRRRRGRRLRVPDQDGPGTAGRPGVRAGLPGRGPDPAAHAAAAAPGRAGLDDRVGGLVRRAGRAVAGRLAPVHRRLHDELPARAGAGLQRPGPHPRRERQRRWWRWRREQRLRR